MKTYFQRTGVFGPSGSGSGEVLLARWEEEGNVPGLHSASCPQGCPVVKGFPKRTLRRAIKRLEREGFIRRWTKTDST